MNKKNVKRILAVAVAGTMALGNGLVVLADGVTGSGVVEYDNSEAIAYDVVEVPTVTAGTYNFTLDPTGQLHAFDADNYGTGTVYFSSIGTRASVTGKTGVTLYTQSKSAVAATSSVWDGIVATVSDDAIATVNSGFFVWVPDTANETYTTGKPGKFVELTADNIGNWFELKCDAADKKIGLKGDYKAGANVCDGKVYENTYTAVTGNKISDSDTDPLSKYVTITNGAPSAFPNLYTDDEGTKATAADVEYAAAETVNQGRTDAVTVINKSTKAKTVTATVTMNNTTGITFNSSATYANDDTKASMYVTATNGTTTSALVASSDGTKATATYTVDLAAPTISEITYMATGTNSATGGHNYARYEANGTVYGSDSFYITASANPNGADAWNTWAASVTAQTRPNINIVYTVADKVTAPAVTETSVSGENNVIHYSVPTGVAVSKVVLLYSEGTQTLELTTGEHYTIDTGAKTITIVSAVLENNVDASNKIKVYFNDTSNTVKDLSIVADE